MPKRETEVSVTTPDGNARGFSFALERDAEGCLCLRAHHRPQYGSIHADWLARDLARRIAAGRRQPLARSLGLHKKTDLRILDATGGLGRDAYTLAALGAHVTLIERHPLVFQLLQDAQTRASQTPQHAAIAARITLIQADTHNWLEAHSSGFDAIYLDPMYPDDGKAALPAKEMQILRELTGGDADADQLLIRARRTSKRIAVKRPRHAPPLAGCTADAVIQSTQLRFDCYQALPASVIFNSRDDPTG